jgi:hypothetical protein
MGGIFGRRSIAAARIGTAQVREARGRRRRRWARIGSGSAVWSGQRSIRMTGRIMTIAESALFSTDFPVRATRQTPGNFTTVPIWFSPARPTPIGHPTHSPAEGK